MRLWWAIGLCIYLIKGECEVAICSELLFDRLRSFFTFTVFSLIQCFHQNRNSGLKKGIKDSYNKRPITVLTLVKNYTTLQYCRTYTFRNTIVSINDLRDACYYLSGNYNYLVLLAYYFKAIVVSAPVWSVSTYFRQNLFKRVKRLRHGHFAFTSIFYELPACALNSHNMLMYMNNINNIYCTYSLLQESQDQGTGKLNINPFLLH